MNYVKTDQGGANGYKGKMKNGYYAEDLVQDPKRYRKEQPMICAPNDYTRAEDSDGFDDLAAEFTPDQVRRFTLEAERQTRRDKMSAVDLIRFQQQEVFSKNLKLLKRHLSSERLRKGIEQSPVRSEEELRSRYQCDK